MFASKDELFTRPSGGYTIARSVRLRSSASAYFNRTPATAGSSTKMTISLWAKRGILSASAFEIMTSGASGANDALRFTGVDALQLWFNGATYYVTSAAVFRDPAAWYHIVASIDTTQATDTNRMVLYVNGTKQVISASAYPAQNYTVPNLNKNQIQYIGYNTSGIYLDGYITEFNFIDGQALTPSSFGSTNAITGVWQPAKYTGTYGTNGFYLNFSDNSSNTATTIGKDYSGNGNNWTPNNISVTAGVTYDSMVDSPTVGATSSNYAVLNPLYPSSIPVDGNLNVVGDSNSRTVAGTMSSSTGKWYAEGTFTSGYATNGWFFVWDTLTPYVAGNIPATTGQTGAYYRGTNGNITKSVTGTTTSIGTYSTWTNGDIIGMAFDADAGTISFYKNNTLQVTITDSAFIGRPLTFGIYYYAGNASMNFGQRPFSYTPPTGYVALNTYNLPDSTIKNGAGYMAATLYTGTGSSLTVSNAVNSVSFQPDFIWIKPRSIAGSHGLFDSVRGYSKSVRSNDTRAEDTSPANTDLTAFNSNGFSVGSSNYIDTSTNGATVVAWQWKASNTTASNTNGSITSTVSVGATQGFSVVTYTGNGTGGATVGHGLGVAPSFILAKGRTNVDNWRAYHSSLGNTGALILNATNAFVTNSTFWNNTSPSSTVVTLGSDTSVNQSSNTFVLYCFSAVAGYSAFGSYTGNGSSDGPFVYTGFRPRWILIKNSNNAVQGWTIQDTSRSTYNVVDNYLLAQASSSEQSTYAQMDYLSNGFKVRTSDALVNGSGNTMIFAAFAENPFRNALAR